MQKGFGFAALIIAFIAIFIPLAGPWMTILAAGLAVFAYGQGLPFGIATIILDVVNIIFLSPSLWVTQAILSIGAAETHQHAPVLPYVLLGAQGLAVIVLVVLHQRFKNGIIIMPPAS